MRYPVKYFLRILKLCLLHRGCSFIRLRSVRFTSSQVPLYIGFFGSQKWGILWKKIKKIFSVPIHRVDVLSQRLHYEAVWFLWTPLLYRFWRRQIIEKNRKYFKIFKLHTWLLVQTGKTRKALRRRMSTPDSSQSPYPSTNRIFRSRFVGVLLKNNFYFFSFCRPIPNWSLQPWLSRVVRVILMNPSII